MIQIDTHSRGKAMIIIDKKNQCTIDVQYTVTCSSKELTEVLSRIEESVEVIKNDKN